MDIDYSYKLKQVQKLALTEEMKLSIKILEMSCGELIKCIEKEFVENPVIEIDEKPIIKVSEGDNIVFRNKKNTFNDISPLMFVSRSMSLNDYLHEQILEIEEDNKIRNIADYIVDCLDSNGYFQMDLDELSEEIEVDIIYIRKALNLVQNLEPYGVGARNLKECLKIQLKKLGINDNVLIKMINENLNDIADGRYKKIADELDITKVQVQKYLNIIKKLEPKPTRGFYTGEDYKYIIPDAEIKKIADTYEIVMNDSLLPKLVISKEYKEILKEEDKGDIQKYIKDKIGKANFFIKSIEERKITIEKILVIILNKQYDYFSGKNKFLKPMTIKEVARELKCNESTVSRAVKDKFVLTSFGVIKIKDLFSVNPIKGNDEEISNEYIKNEIKKLIEKEDKENPISDQKIVNMLKENNLKISRRTVAKYREEMGIKSSHRRKIY